MKPSALVTKTLMPVLLIGVSAASAGVAQAARPVIDGPQANVGKNRRAINRPIQQSLVVEDPNVGSVTLFNYEEADAFGSSSRWGVGYQARASGKATRTQTEANTRLDGYINTWGRLFGNSFGIATLTTTGNTIAKPQSKWAGIWYSVYLFGQKVKEDTVGGGSYSREKKIFDKTQQIGPEYTTTFTVATIPVTVSASAHANEFIALKGTFWFDGISGTAKPGGSVKVKGRAGVGVAGASVGVQVNLSLLTAELPATATLKWAFRSTKLVGLPGLEPIGGGGIGTGPISLVPMGCTASLAGDVNLTLTLQELNGTFDVYARFLSWDENKRIASWNGLKQNYSLVNVSRTWNFGGRGSCGVPATTPPQMS